MPIRVRLALWYGAIFGVALAAFGITLYVLMARHLEGMVSEVVASETDHVITAIRAANQSNNATSATTVPPLETFQASDVYIQVLDPDGGLLARSSNLEGRRLPLPDGSPGRAEYVATLDGLKLKASMTPMELNGQTAGWVQLATSYRQRDMVLTRLRLVLIGGGLATVGVVGLLAGLLAGNALQPVSEMIETARAIALSRGFSRRLSVGSPNDELGQLAQAFNEMLTSLEKAYSTQQRFVADASHELRAPLTAIRGNLDLLDRMKEMPSEERQYTLAQVRREVERLSRLVNDLLVLARADAGQVLQVRPVELDALVIEAHRQALAMANGVEVRLAHAEPALVQGDEDRLKQLLLVLLDNAIRYTPAGGRVTLWLRPEPPWVAVGVEDTGIGIEPQDLPHIFERFWRADRARSRDSGGTGLGLAIAKWIVDQHGGEITVDSTPGKGSRFTVHLPASS